MCIMCMDTLHCSSNCLVSISHVQEVKLVAHVFQW